MTSFYVWLAFRLRQFAQWLDPLPTEDAVQLTLIALLRAEVACETHAHQREAAAHAIEVDDLMNAVRQAREAFAALDRKHQQCIPVAHDELFEAARALTAHWENRHAPSSEYRRAQVMAGLIDAFPDRKKKEMALALEAALWQ